MTRFLGPCHLKYVRYPLLLDTVNSFELLGTPLHRRLGVACLDRPGVGVYNDVFRPGKRRLFVRRPGVTRVDAVLGLLPEGRHLRVLEPHRVICQLLNGLQVVALLNSPPRIVLLVLEPPPQELLRPGDVLGVLEDGPGPRLQPVEPASRPLWDKHVVHVPGDLRLVLLGSEVDARAVEGGCDLPRQEGAVVAAVVPGRAGLVVAVLPCLGELPHGIYELGLVERDRLLVLGNLHGAMGPHVGIGEIRWIAGAVPKSLAKRMAGRLTLLGHGMVFIPCHVELVAVLGVGYTGFLEPADSIVAGVVAEAGGDAQPPVAHLARLQNVLLEAATTLAELLCFLGEVHQVVPIQEIPGRPQLHEVHTTGLYCRRDLGLQIRPVQKVDGHRDTSHLAPLLCLFLEEILGGCNEVSGLKNRKLCSLNDGWGSEDLPSQPTYSGHTQTSNSSLNEIPPTHLLLCLPS